MREIFTTAEAYERGVSPKALRHGERTGRWRRLAKGVYGAGPEEPSDLDRARAYVIATHGVACGRLAAVLHGLDGVSLAGPGPWVANRSGSNRPGVRRGSVTGDRIVRLGRLTCADGLQTLIDLVGILDDATWEQALESALRKRLVTIADLEAALPELGRRRTPGVGRVRRVLSARPQGAPPTESLLETLMVQLVRRVPELPPPTRQYVVRDAHDGFVARVDLAWPELGLFLELDGQHHKGQPLYDARRETAIVAATGWLCGRFTWTEVTRHPTATARRLSSLVDQARRRPLAS